MMMIIVTTTIIIMIIINIYICNNIYNTIYIYGYILHILLTYTHPLFPQQQNALGSSAIVKVSEQAGAAPQPIPPRFPRFPRFPSRGSHPRSSSKTHSPKVPK